MQVLPRSTVQNGYLCPLVLTHFSDGWAIWISRPANEKSPLLLFYLSWSIQYGMTCPRCEPEVGTLNAARLPHPASLPLQVWTSAITVCLFLFVCFVSSFQLPEVSLPNWFYFTKPLPSSKPIFHKNRVSVFPKSTWSPPTWFSMPRFLCDRTVQ